ncbi:MAG: hypothetical protein K6G61_02650 [Solobacterium sp.]|nr:hypothetical protein [Solobacterium sp.]
MGVLQEKLLAGQLCFGSHISLNDPSVTELVGNVGFDYLWIDTEHTTIDLDHLQMHLIAARAAGVSAIVRIPWNDPVRAKPVLEMGPDGLVFPQIQSFEEAELAVQSCMYPPRGIRGFGPRRAVQYGRIPASRYLDEIDGFLLKFLQIEHIGILKDLPRIVRMPEITGFVIGPCDFAASMGKIRDMDHPDVHRKIDEAIVIVRDAGKVVALSQGPTSDEALHNWYHRGVRMISYGSDVRSILAGAQESLNRLKNTFKD